MDTISKPKFKTLWTNTSPINYQDIEVSEIIDCEPVGIAEIDNRQTIVATKGNSLYLLDTVTFSQTQKPIRFHNKSCGLYNHTLVNSQNEWYFITSTFHVNTPTCFIIVNISTREVFKHTYEFDDSGIRDIKVTQIDGTLYALVLAYGTGVDKWNISTQQITGTWHFPECYHLKMSVLDDVLRISGGVGFIDIRTCQLTHRMNGYYLEGYNHNTLLDVKLNGKWHTITCGSTYDGLANRIFIWDTFTGEILRELPNDLDPNNGAGWDAYICYNKNEDPLLVVTQDRITSRAMVYNLNSIENGFEYFKDFDTRIDAACLEYIDAAYHHLYNDCNYLSAGVIPTYLGDEPVLVEKGTTKMWSLETLQPIKSHPLDSCVDIRALYPLTLPNGHCAFVVNDGTIWNPLGQARDYMRTQHIQSVRLDEKDLLVTASEDGFIRLYDTHSGKLLKQSEKIEQKIINLLIAPTKGEQMVLVGLEDRTFELYKLPDLQKTTTKIVIGNFYTSVCVAQFGGKIQLIAAVNYNICSWDIETGLPVHQPIQITKIDGEAIGEVEIDMVFKLILWKTHPVLVVTLMGCDHTFLWDLDSSKCLGRLDFDKTMMKQVEEYDVTEASLVSIDHKEILLTGSPIWRIACFDAHTLKRTEGRIITASTDYDYLEGLQALVFNNRPLAVARAYTELKVYDLLTSKLIKNIAIDAGIASFTISENKIIVCYGENITAIEVQ